jgi:hypothetical protein
MSRSLSAPFIYLKLKYFIVMGLMDGIGILLGLIAKPHISGSVATLLFLAHSLGDLVVLCPQTSVLFVMIVTMMFLGTKYTYWQIWSVLFIMFGVLLTLIPKFAHLSEGGMVTHCLVI